MNQIKFCNYILAGMIQELEMWEQGLHLVYKQDQITNCFSLWEFEGKTNSFSKFSLHQLWS